MNDDTWRDFPAWLRKIDAEIPDGLLYPHEIAAFEAANFQRCFGSQIEIIPDETMEDEAYRIAVTSSGFRLSGGRTGILTGTYDLILRLLSGDMPKEGVFAPAYSLRMLDSWDNMDGSVERGYSGRSLWFEGGCFSYERDRIRALGRLLASCGINILCINNVNVLPPAESLPDLLLKDAAEFAEILRPFGIRLMFSVDFSLPLQRGLTTADPLNPEVRKWWSQLSERLWKEIPDFAGFLVKADSEHRPGPRNYGRSHAEGANMLAEAVAPFHGVIVWRAFVYNCMQDWRDSLVDRPCAAYDLYQPLDGQFLENVILQVKYGPFDFQVREPVSPVLLSMRHTNLSVELQLAQEYTGQQIDLFAMPPMWREIFDALKGSSVTAAAAVSNLGRDACWTGHPFAALNLFAFGCFSRNPDTRPGDVIRQWIRLSYDLPEEEEDLLFGILTESRDVYEKYTAPLGLNWMVVPGSHYGPSPYGYEFDVWGTYNRADRDFVGIDRTEKGTGYTSQYPPALRTLYEDKDLCPEKLLLFFHRLPYTYRMKDGRTLIQRIYDDHFEGCGEVSRMQKSMETLHLPERDRREVLKRMEKQKRNAEMWRDVINTFFHRFSGIDDAKGRKIYP